MIETMTQLSLGFTADTRIVPAPSSGSLDERFEAWANANPAIVDAFETLALMAVRRGRRRVGAKAIAEVLRFQYELQVDDPDGWKINNSYVSRLCRLVCERRPELRSAFEMRELKSRAA